MLKIIRNSFRFKNIFAIRKFKSKSFVFFFIVLMLINSLPLNVLIIKNKGWKFNPIVNNLEQDETAWLTKDENGKYLSYIIFKYDGLHNSLGKPYHIKTQNYDFYISPEVDVDTSKGNVIIMKEDEVTFYRENGQKLVGSYGRLDETIDFQYIRTEEEARTAFIDVVETVFSGPFIFSSMLIWTSINIVMQLILLLLISSIFLLIRINYKKVATYKEYLKMYIASLVIPTIVAVGIGLIGEAAATFSPVILQMGTALMMIGVLYKGSKSEISHPRRLKDQM